MTGVTVVVDFGSAHTVVVARPPQRLVTVEPSVVALSQDDRLVAGHAALRLATAGPSGLLTRLATRLDERDVLVGDTVLPVGGLVRAVLAQAVSAVDEPVAELVLVHPAGWPSERVAVLVRAAAGLAARINTVTAPVAAAAGAEIEPGATVLVVDFGASSCEVAAVRRSAEFSAGFPGEFEVLAHGSLPLGGDDLDDRVSDHLGGSADARLRKEQVVATGSADGLSVEDFERLIAGEVAKVVHLAERVVAEAPVDRVLLVGGSSRVPMVGRRVAEAVTRPVRLAAQPEQAVAWGALHLAVPDPAARVPAAQVAAGRARPLRPVRRRIVVAAALVVLVLVAGAVALMGFGPGQLTAGLPGAADVPPPSAREAAMPPELAGAELVSTGQPAFAPGRMGVPVRYRHPSGTTLELTLSGAQAQRGSAPPLAEAPLGYRWVTVPVTGANVAGPAWRQDLTGTVSALDDRGQWIRPLSGGVGACAGSAPVPETVPPGGSFDACVSLPVPEATPVTSVVVGAPGGQEPPIRFPVAIPPASASARSAPPRAVGRLGEPPIEVRVDGVPVRAGFHLVMTPSGYLGDQRPAPGNRYVVVRAQLPGTGTAEHVYLRDDRGVLTRPLTGFDAMPDCPPFDGPGDRDELVYACFVYELDANVRIDGVTLGSPIEAGREIESWPTWRAG